MRRAAKVDGNQSAIVQALERMGLSVRSTAALGDGFPDLVIFSPRVQLTLLAEVKEAKGSFTGAQLMFYRSWSGPVYVLRAVTDAIYIANGDERFVERWEGGLHYDARPVAVPR